MRIRHKHKVGSMIMVLVLSTRFVLNARYIIGAALDLLVWNNSLASELAEVEYVLYVWPHVPSKVVYNGILFLFCFILGAR